MSFRRDCETTLAWQRWVSTHQDELIVIGIPREVWGDCLIWNRFLEHGYHPPIENVCEFRLDDLSPVQQQKFYRFLSNNMAEGGRPGNDVWMILHQRFGSEVDDHSA